MELPAQLLAAVPHITFSIFNIALPNLIVILLLIVIFCVAVWARLPRIFESES
jgi:hypothetical protein